MESRVDDASLPAGFGLAAGCVGVVAAAFGVATAVAPHDVAARAVVMAVVAGVAATLIADWRACLGVTVFAALVFVGFLAHRYGDLTGDDSAWPYTILIGFAAVLGRGQRWMRGRAAAGQGVVPSGRLPHRAGW